MAEVPVDVAAPSIGNIDQMIVLNGANCSRRRIASDQSAHGSAGDVTH
jgi:hypothetical protein